MSTPDRPGSIAWLDLTVDDAEGVRSGPPVAGVCHARGRNQGLPAVWLPYIVVADLAAALVAAEERGGAVVRRPATSDGGSYAVIRDPAGAFSTLVQAPASA